MDHSTLRLALVCVLSLWVLSSGLPFVGVVSGHQFNYVDETTSTNGIVEETDDALGESTTGIDDAVNETTGESDETASETIDGGSAVGNETTDRIEQTATETTEAIDDAVDRSTPDVDGGTNSSVITETTDQNDTVDETIDELDETADDLEETVDETTDDVHGAVNETIDGVNGTDDTTNIVLHERDQRWTTATVETVGGADDGTGDAKPGGRTSRNERRSKGQVTTDVPEIGTTANGYHTGSDTSSGETPGSRAGVGVTIVSLLTITASAMTLTGSPGIATVSASVSSPSGRAAFRALRAGLHEPWKYAASVLRYSPYDESDPLEHEHRRTVYQAITENPGVYLSELGESSDISLSTVRHHLQVLERENLIKSEKIRGKRRFYPVGADDTALVAALSDPAVRSLLETLADLGDARNDRLVEELERSPSTVSHHLSSLEEDGLIVRERRGRTNVNRLAPDVANSLGEGGIGEGDQAVKRGRSED